MLRHIWLHHKVVIRFLAFQVYRSFFNWPLPRCRSPPTSEIEILFPNFKRNGGYFVAKRYFRKNDPAAQESNPEWIEMSGQEFYRFITSPAGRERFFIDMEEFVIEAPKEIYEEWRREQSRKSYHYNQAMKLGVKVLSLNSDEISEKGDGEDVIPDETVYVEEDAILSSEIHDLYAALSQLDHASYQLIYSYYLAEDHKSESQIAEELGISQPAVHKQKKKILKSLKNRLLTHPKFCNKK